MESPGRVRLRATPPATTAEAFFRSYIEILELLEPPQPLAEVLEKIARLIESTSPGSCWCMIATVGTVPPDLLIGAAPSIPESFLKVS